MFQLLSILFFCAIFNRIQTQYTFLNVTTNLCLQTNYLYCRNMTNIQYRTANGACNNLAKPWLGISVSPMKRINNVNSAYADAAGNPRSKAVSGKPLPNARDVARAVMFPKDSFHNSTVFHTLFGQMVAHDISLSPQPQDATGRNMECFCHDVNNPLCIVTGIPSDDTINSNQACFALPRTTSTNLNWNCMTGFREQINRLTAWLDLSEIYGTNDAKMNSLRSKVDSGYLFTQTITGNSRPVFQFGPSGANQCLRDTVQMPCFNSGEGRTNENTALASVQAVFLRQHNLIAATLQNLTGWTNSFSKYT